MDRELKRKLAAILVADVVGYSRLIADDEEATLRRLEVFRGIWQDGVVRCGGRIFNTAGDAILAEFPSVVEAVRCAVDFQAEARVQNDTMVENRQMHFRIGITVGDVVERGSDLLGDGVNIAARLQTLARSGGICVSSWVREQVGNKLGVTFTDLGEQSVKNIPTPIRAYLIAAPGTQVAGSPAVQDSAAMQDWLGRAVSSWKSMATVTGIAVAGIAGAFLVVAQMRTTPKPTPAPPPDAKLAAVPTPGPAAGNTEQKSPAPAPPSGPAVRVGLLTEAIEHDLKPGEAFKECDNCPEMVVIPTGEFVMGSSSGEPGHERDEAPTRKVTVAKRIAVARYAVTVDEFDTFVTVAAYRPPPGCRVFEAGGWREKPELSFRNPGFEQTGTHPVVCINWHDAKAYTDWMSARLRVEYRLPTEAEREYATRAGTTSLYSWGDQIGAARAAYDWSVSFNGSPTAAARRGTHPVDAFQPNPWGLFQLHGNVSEWVEDCWNENYRNAPLDVVARTSGDCRRRVLRGGSWGYSPKDLRSAYREGATATNRNFNFGFRVVRVLR